MKFKYYVDVGYWNGPGNPPTAWNDDRRHEPMEGTQRFTFEIEIPDDSIPIENPKVKKEE